MTTWKSSLLCDPESGVLPRIVMRYDPYAPIGTVRVWVAGRDTVPRFQDIKVILRSGNGARAWMVEVDTNSPLPELLPDLVRTLPIPGEPDDYELLNEGSIQKPVLVLVDKNPGRVGNFTEINPDNE